MTKKSVGVIQSNYIPWKGYFDIIHDVDHFIFYDDIQYTKNDWRNRNKIKTAQGIAWLTIPVGAHLGTLICDVKLHDGSWRRKHWTRLKQCYSEAPYFRQYRDFLQYVFLDAEWTHLSELNQFLVRQISREYLGIQTEFRDSRDYRPQGVRLDRLIDMLQKAGATQYVSGPAAKAYIDDDRFREAGIELVYKDYAGYPEYPQLFPPFEHGVSILDLLFNCGPAAPDYIWGWREAARHKFSEAPMESVQ